MMTVQQIRIDCPKCKIFAVRLKSAEAEVEVNCSRCHSVLVIRVVDGRLSIETGAKMKQAT